MGMTLDEYDCQPPCSRGLAFLKQDVGHMRKVRAYETEVARYRAALERAAEVLIDGDIAERAQFHLQIKELLQSQERAS
jgi:hypothetical protein